MHLRAAHRVVDQFARESALRRVAQRALEGRALEQPLSQSFDRLVADALRERRRERTVDGLLETLSAAGLDVAARRRQRLGAAANRRLDHGGAGEHSPREKRDASEPQPEVEREGGQTEDGLRAVGRNRRNWLVSRGSPREVHGPSVAQRKEAGIVSFG